MTPRVPTFRLRMFLVTTLIVAAVLASVALVSGSTFYAYEIQRLDARLCAEGWRLAERPPRADEIDRFARDVAGKLRLQSVDQLLLERHEGGAGGEVVYGRWPREITLDQLAWSDAPVGSLPQGPGDPVATPAGVQPGATSEQGARRSCRIASLDTGDSGWRAARVLGPDGEGIVAANVAVIHAELWAALQRISLIAAPMALVFTALGAWLLSGLALRPVNRLRDAMKSVHERALDQRLPVGREDSEFCELIASYNEMLERLEASFNQASRFSADAAHELKTPLTILRGQIERAIPKAKDPELQQELAEVLDEVGRLASISRKLLLLSQADAGKLALLRTEADLSAMLNERLADAQMLELDATLAAEVEPGLRLQADEQLLGQVLNNVLGNAFRYTPPGGRIGVRARSTPAGVEVLFRNTVRELSPVERSRFFERFYRGDSARNRRADGHGLGLSLSRVIARAHGGDLTLEPGSEYEVVLKLTLPRSPGASA